MDNGVRFETLMARIRSDAHKNSTLAVRDGTTLPGFQRPCPRKNTKNKSPPGRSCYDKVPMLTIPVREKRTEVVLDSVAKFPALLKDPLLSYNQRVMEARVGTLKHVSANSNSMKLSVRYMCFQDGVGNISVTLYWDGYRPTDISWKKRCTMPQIHVSVDRYTAPQLLSLVFVVCVLFGIFLFGVCYMRGRKARTDLDAADLDAATPSEKASMVGKRTPGVTIHPHVEKIEREA